MTLASATRHNAAMVIIRSLTLWATITTIITKALEWGLNWHWLIATIVALNLATFLAMGVDKMAAQFNQRRMPEAAFLLLGLVGGMAGLLIASQIFRHKTVKKSFRMALYGVLAIQIIAALWLVSWVFG